MRLEAEVHKALKSASPLVTMRSLLLHQIDGGRPREVLYQDLASLHLYFEEAGREIEDDLVLEAMDLVAGWCSPHVAL